MTAHFRRRFPQPRCRHARDDCRLVRPVLAPPLIDGPAADRRRADEHHGRQVACLLHDGAHGPVPPELAVTPPSSAPEY